MLGSDENVSRDGAVLIVQLNGQRPRQLQPADIEAVAVDPRFTKEAPVRKAVFF